MRLFSMYTYMQHLFLSYYESSHSWQTCLKTIKTIKVLLANKTEQYQYTETEEVTETQEQDNERVQLMSVSHMRLHIDAKYW